MSNDLESRRDAGGNHDTGYGSHHTATGAAISAVAHNTPSTDPAYTHKYAVDPRDTRSNVQQQSNGIGSGPRVRSTSDRLEVILGRC